MFKYGAITYRRRRSSAFVLAHVILFGARTVEKNLCDRRQKKKKLRKPDASNTTGVKKKLQNIIRYNIIIIVRVGRRKNRKPQRGYDTNNTRGPDDEQTDTTGHRLSVRWRTHYD